MPSPVCKTCDSPDCAAIEVDGQLALAGEISWREAGRRWGADAKAIKNHMERHLVVEPVVDPASRLRALCEATAQELEDTLHMLPLDLRPLQLIEIHNLRHLDLTKPSTQNLIMATKTKQEATGMKAGQRVMLAFAEAMFGGTPIPVASTTVLELEEVNE